MMRASGNKIKSITLNNLTASFLAAGALAVLITLSLWKFELRSISRLLLQCGALAAVIWLLLYFLFYRKLINPIQFDLKTLLLCAAASFFISFQIIPQQVSARYVLVIVLSAIAFLLVNLTLLLALANRENIPWNTIFMTSALVCGLLGLAIILFNALSVRIYGDDFANVLKLERLGVWESGLLFYRSWSGRFTSNFLVMGFSNKPRAPLLFLALIEAALFLVLRFITTGQPSKWRLTALAGAAFLPFAVYTAAPDMYKSLYWNASSMTLLPLMVMIPVYLAFIFHLLTSSTSHSIALILMGMALSFAITTTHEAAAVGWLGMHLAVLIWFFLSRSKNHPLRNFLLAGLFASAAGIAVLLASPGAGARIAAQEYTLSRQAVELVLSTLRYFIDFLKVIARPVYIYHGAVRPGWLLVAAAAGLGWLTETRLKRRFANAAVILLLSIAMAAAAFFPGAYILGETIPLRTQFIPSLYLVLGSFIFGLLAPRPASRHLKVVLLLLALQMLLIGSAVSISQLTRTIEPMRQYARDWDLRDYKARTASELTHRLKVPWEQYEQNLGDFRKYYRSRKVQN